MTNRPISISTLSPVHIGCDEVYEPSNFVIHDRLLHALNPSDLASDLSDAERHQLATLADGREPIGALQRFFRERAERFANLSHHQVEVAPDIVKNYQQPTQRGTNGEATYNVFPIARTAYRVLDNAPYLPGSSLKGSMRTAWLNQLNQGHELKNDEKRDRKSASRNLQQRLLGYTAGKFEKDPFRHVQIADAQPDDDTPTRILYAISKKKRVPRDGEGGVQELKVFLEVLPEALPAAFDSDIRLTGNIQWDTLCDACNGFYRPQLESELNHDVLGNFIDVEWKQLVGKLLGNELGKLMEKHQGFLLRVGRHSGAESMTLQGIRDIKILGPRVDGKQTFDFRPNTTEKRFASLTKAGLSGLLPFGWIWIDASDDAHRHLFDNIRQKLAQRSKPVRQSHRDRLLHLEEKQHQREVAIQQKEAEWQAKEAAACREAAEQAARQAAMTANLQLVEEFRSTCVIRAGQLLNNKENANAAIHNKARTLAKAAHEGVDWTVEEKCAAADAIEEWLPKLVKIDIKDERKKLKLAVLRT